MSRSPAPGDWQSHSNNQILAHYAHLIENKCVLDVGCNHGAVTKLVTNYNPSRICGVDINQQALNTALTEWPNEKVEFVCENLTSIDSLPFETGSFDLIYSFHTLEHIFPEDLETFVKNVVNMLADNGFLLIAVPYDRAYNDKTHVSFFDNSSLIKTIEQDTRMSVYEILDKDRWSDPDILVALFKKQNNDTKN